MKTSYKRLFALFLLINFGTIAYHDGRQVSLSSDAENPSQRTEIQTQAESSDISTSTNKGKDLLESSTLSQQLALIELKSLLAKVKDDVKHAPYCLSDKDYLPIMHLVQKKKEALEAQIKTLESTLPEQPESIDVEDFLQKSFTIIAGSFATLTIICLIIQSSREDDQYHFPSFNRLMKNIR